jgi:hypothetical protein
VPQLRDIAADHLGLRTPKRKRQGGQPLSESGMYRVFANPFYTGHILYDKQWYTGKHEPMITVEQFERAQVLLGRTNAPRPKTHIFAYTGLMRCGFCGSSITAENKVNRFGSQYVYYHCTRKKHNVACGERSVEERGLERQILAFLESIYLDRHEVDEIFAIIDEERARGCHGGLELTLKRTLESCARHIGNLTKMRYRDLIPDDEFLRQRADLTQEQSKLKQRLSEINGEQWVEPSRNLFFFSNRAVFWLTHGTTNEKRQILSTVGSNPKLMAKKLNIDAKEPFLILHKFHSISDRWRVVRDVRTFFQRNPTTVIPLLPESQLELN